MRITICAYDGEGYFGGPLEWYKRLAPALRDIGVEARFLFITDSEPHLCGTYGRLKKQGFDCQALRRHSLTQLRDNTEARVRWILKHLRRAPPDLFVPNLSIAGCFAGRWAQEAGIPVVPVVHSDDDFYMAMTAEFVVKTGDFRLAAAACVSRMLEESVRRRGPATFVERIPCGTCIPQKNAVWSDGVFRIAYVGRFVEKGKRVRDLTHAFCSATSWVEGVEAVLYGDGPERSAVEQIVRDRGCETTVRVAGKIDSALIQEKLLECHAIVLLSELEGLPIALMEGMACGLVPVCLDVRSGIPELVEHGETGLLVKDREDDFVSAIRELRNDRDLWQRMSHAARRKMEREYAMPVVARKWQSLAESLRADGGRVRPVRVPWRLSLPPVNRCLAGDDRRWGSSYAYLGRQVRRVARRLAG